MIFKWKWKSLSHVQLCESMDYTVHGILQARILEWVAFPFFSRSSNPGIKSRCPALQADSLQAGSQGKRKNTGVGSLSLLQQILPTQELNQGLLHCRRIIYQLSYQGIPPWHSRCVVKDERKEKTNMFWKVHLTGTVLTNLSLVDPSLLFILAQLPVCRVGIPARWSLRTKHPTCYCLNSAGMHGAREPGWCCPQTSASGHREGWRRVESKYRWKTKTIQYRDL